MSELIIQRDMKGHDQFSKILLGIASTNARKDEECKSAKTCT